MLTITSIQAKSPGAIFSYNCQVGNPEIFHTINQDRMKVGESGKIEFKLTRQSPIKILEGSVNRYGEQVDIQLTLRGMRLASNLEDVPRVGVKLRDITNSYNIFSARGIDAEYRIKNENRREEEDEEKISLSDISVDCQLESRKPREADKSEIAKLIALFFLSLRQ